MPGELDEERSGLGRVLSLCLPGYFLLESFPPPGSSHSDANAFAWVRRKEQGAGINRQRVDLLFLAPVLTSAC